MGKANRTHQAPPIIENLGDGSYYYNFNVEEKSIDSEENNQVEGLQFDYDQVRCKYPVDIEVIQECVIREGFDHQVSLEGYEEV